MISIDEEWLQSPERYVAWCEWLLPPYRLYYLDMNNPDEAVRDDKECFLHSVEFAKGRARFRKRMNKEV